MTRFLLIILVFISISENASSQLIDSVYQGLSLINSIRKIDSSTFIIVTYDSKVHALDFEGNILWTKDIAPGVGQHKHVLSYFRAFPDQQDSFFYVTTIDDHCDYFEDPRLFKIDFAGNVIDIHLFPDFTWFFEINIYPNSVNGPEFILHDYKEIVIQYPNDSTIIIPLNSPIEKLDVNADGDFAVLTEEHIYYYIKDSTGFIVSDSIEVEDFHNLFFNFYFNQDNKLIWSNQEQLTSFNSKLDTLNSFRPLANEKIAFSKEIDTNTIIITRNNDKTMNFYLLDQQLHKLMYHHLGLSDHYYSDFEWSTDSVLTIVGKEFYRDYKLYSFVKQFNFSTAGTENGYDIGISDLKFDNLIDKGISECFSEELHMYDLNNVAIEITNNGNSTINNLTITPLKSYCFGGFCNAEPLYFTDLQNMNLHPGETKEYSLNSLKISVDRFDTTSELCLLAILPDYHVDINHSDNIFCFDLTVSQSNVEDENITFFYPNPTSDRLYFSGQTEILEVSIYSLEGKRVSNFARREIEHKSFDISHLTPGMYFVRYRTTDGIVFTNKIIKV